MPLIVEDGTGLSNAESLASVEFFYLFHEGRGNTVAAALAAERVEQLLRIATDYIKYILGNSFAGRKSKAGQSLPFPRIINYRDIGNPVAVQEATAELALVANSTPLMPSTSTARKRSVKVGPISVEYDANSGPRFVNGVSRLGEFMGGSASGMTTKLVRT